MKIANQKVYKRVRRHRRVRNKIVGTPERPRLCVYKSLKHIYAQVVDDTFVNEKGEKCSKTIAAVSTLKLAPVAEKPAESAEAAAETKEKGKKGKKDKKGKKAWTGGKKTAGAREVGRLIAEAAKQKGVSKVAFDRGGYQFHGRVAALAEEARKNGLEF
jgi:large subunit ribosomal protein L18